jgi:hypothetical protein
MSGYEKESRDLLLQGVQKGWEVYEEDGDKSGNSKGRRVGKSEVSFD